LARIPISMGTCSWRVTIDRVPNGHAAARAPLFRTAPLREATGRAMPRAVEPPHFDSNGDQIVPLVSGRTRWRPGTVRASTRSSVTRMINSRLCMIVAGVSLVAGAAVAQTTSPAPNETMPGAKTDPSAQSLSKELSQSNGVVHPKEVDPGIQKPAPLTGDLNVVPPPGTSRGAPAPRPK
jgi:hypothetical protein